MLCNLLGQQTDASIEADVHVIGAGIAGLLIAERLARAGLRTVVSESGGEVQSEETHPLNDVVHVRSVYAGAMHGRFRCLGGTSTRWGGAMLPLLSADVARAEWRLVSDELLRYRGEVERLFGLPAGPYDFPDFIECEDKSRPSHVARFAKWPAFAKRNMARLLAAQISSEKGPEVWLNATAVDFSVHPDGRLDAVTARAPNGRRLTVRARETVLAAGAIESTRLLLLADRQHGDRIFRADDVLGRYFHDHLSVAIGRVHPRDRTAFNRVFGFRFQGGGMRNIRFEPSEDSDRQQLPASFAHIAFAADEGGPFDTLREVFRRIQRGQLPTASLLTRVALGAPWLTRAAYWRFVEQRLLYPPHADIEVHMVIEQKPSADNRIGLAGRLDAYGQPLASIDWIVTADDEANLAKASDAFVNCWNRSTLAQHGLIERRPAQEAADALVKGGGVYHPCGSTRIGRSPAEGVVDTNLRTFRVPNLSVVATSVFPSVGGANPTMTLMMAALRNADSLVSSMRGSART